MLGKLFNLGTGQGTTSPSTQSPSHRTIPPLESVQEDAHTRNLLFPDPQDLYEHRLNEVFPLSGSSTFSGTSSANVFDYHGDIELEARDVRVIIMQDALSSVTASLLYDSQAPPPLPSPPADRPPTGGPSHFAAFQDSRRTPTSPRKPSLSHARPLIIQPDSPQLRQGAFERRPSVQSRHHVQAESDVQRAWREYREELTTFSNCIFGNSELMAYKGTSTKVHVVPSETRPIETPSLGDGRGSLGRSSMRASRLSQSFSSEDPFPFHAPSTPGAMSRGADKKKVLITRLFPVTLPTDEEPLTTPMSRFSDDNAGFPFPPVNDEPKVKKKKPQVKQKRTPMYAVALVISLPQTPSPPPTFTKPVFRGAGSFTEVEFLPSSYNSMRPFGWTTLASTGQQIDMEQSVASDADDPMEAITQHWDIIMRTVTRLQAVATSALYTMLRQTDLASPDPFPASVSSVSAQIARTPSLSGRRSEEGASYKPPKTNAKIVTLLPNCLLENRQVGFEVEMAKTRIVSGLRATRVITGQNRWPIWREEARWVARWANDKDQDAFVFNLLTGFLATHTDWLQALGPSSYRRRYVSQQKNRTDEDTMVSSRTVIVAQDKMVARRLIFLLSAFLPATQQLPTLRAHRPSTSTSFGAAFSQSPPSFVVPILKEESLRRKINRRGGTRRASHSRNLSQISHGRSGAVPGSLAHLAMEAAHERRPSDAASIRTTDLPISGNDSTTRKSSAATMATVTAETTIPHFSIAHRSEYLGHHRPSSSSSIATDDLKRLAREDSQGSDSRPNSRWGSVISGLWNTRRRDSGTVIVPPRARSPYMRDEVPTPPMGAASHADQVDPLANVASKIILSESPRGGVLTAIIPERDDSSGSRPSREISPTSREQPRSLLVETKSSQTRAAGVYESPVKTTINLDDGVIDVDVPFPDYITASFETAVSSPSSSGYLSTPGFGTTLDSFEQACRVSVDGDAPANVAGWLQAYHPDFVLQAIPSQAEILEQIKASMRAEPSPGPWFHATNDSTGGATERWMDIGTTLIIDAKNFTVTRLRYRRLVRIAPSLDRSYSFLPGSLGSYNSSSTALLTPALPPVVSPLDSQEDEFIEETVEIREPLLSAALERVIATGKQASGSDTASTEASSRSTSHQRMERKDRRERSNSASTGTGSDEARQIEAPGTEVPRSRCKKVVLSALESIIREMVEQRDHEKEDGHGISGRRGEENALRGAVREWLEMIDASE